MPSGLTFYVDSWKCVTRLSERLIVCNFSGSLVHIFSCCFHCSGYYFHSVLLLFLLYFLVTIFVVLMDCFYDFEGVRATILVVSLRGLK